MVLLSRFLRASMIKDNSYRNIFKLSIHELIFYYFNIKYMQVLFAFTAMNCFYTNNEKYNLELKKTMIIAKAEMEKEFILLQ